MIRKGNILEVEKLKFNWEKKNSFNLNISKLVIKNNEKVVLLGESGSGKSTLLNLISGIVSPNVGKILINGIQITSLSAKEKDAFRNNNLGVIFQKFNIIHYLSPISNILLPCYFSAIKKNTIDFYKYRAVDLGKSLSIEKNILFQKNSKDLSVGQQQRVAIIRALINFPKIILADEPTSSLDKKNKNKFLKLLFKICKQEKTALLMVTHDNSITKYFDKTIILENIKSSL